MHFLNVNVHFALGALLHVLLELIDFRAFASDDDARTSCENPHHQFVGGPFDFDGADARGLQLFFQFLAQLHIFMKQFSVIATGVPARLPRLVVAEAESVWMRFLSHGFPLVGYPFWPCFPSCCFPVKAYRTRQAVPRTPLFVSASASLLLGRSAATT